MIILDNKLRVPAGLVTKAMLDACTFPNPEFAKLERLGKWTGNCPRVIKAYERDGDMVLFPRGALEFLPPCGLQETLVDDLVAESSSPVSLRPYQTECVDMMIRAENGVACMPCGAGKTRVGCAVVGRLGVKTLILVHTNELRSQWVQAITDLIDGQSAHVRTVQEMVNTVGDEDTFGCVILDEAHHCPAKTFRDVISRFKARYLFGLTATPERADGLTPLMHLYIGPIVYQVRHEELIRDGYLIKPTIERVYTSSLSVEDDYAKILDDLVSDPVRNAQIIRLVTGHNRKSILILSNRIDHCEALASDMRALGLAAEAVTSRTPKKQRVENMRRFRDGELRIVCATSLADEGLDVARLEQVVLALPTRSKGRTIQRLGRLMRPFPGKAQPVLCDLIDSRIPMLRYQYQARRRAYREVFGVIDGATELGRPEGARRPVEGAASNGSQNNGEPGSFALRHTVY